MSVQLRFFSMLKERLGTGERVIDLPAPKAAKEIFVGLFDDRRSAERLLRSVRFAVNCEYVSPDALVRDGDELAVIPPVSGG